MNKIKIFVATHKKYDILDNKIYIPLQVGSALNSDLGYQKDSTGKNISKKNKSFCELTGLYWIWKNCKADITGLVHYRRYFYKNMFSNKKTNILNKEDIEKELKDNDCIVTKKSKVLYGTVEDYYCKKHHKQDYDATRKIIEEQYPEYKESFEKVSKSNFYYNLNMMICRKDIFNKYCEWLFGILFEVEKITDITNYSDYDKRLYGFLSEILLRVWLDKNNMKLKECYVYNNEIGFFKQFIKRIVMNMIVNRK